MFGWYIAGWNYHHIDEPRPTIESESNFERDSDFFKEPDEVDDDNQEKDDLEICEMDEDDD